MGGEGFGFRLLFQPLLAIGMEDVVQGDKPQKRISFFFELPVLFLKKILENFRFAHAAPPTLIFLNVFSFRTYLKINKDGRFK